MMPVIGSEPGVKSEPHNSDIEADVALGRCAPSGPRSLIPVVGQTTNQLRPARRQHGPTFQHEPLPDLTLGAADNSRASCGQHSRARPGTLCYRVNLCPTRGK
jgi:hypothetical protein